jgi:hypothetical protein
MSFFVIEPSKFLDLVTLSNPDVVKTTSFDLETAQNGAGAFVAAITGVTQANQGLPDYFVYVTVMGQMLVECDPDKSLIRQLYADTLASVQRWTPASVTAALGWDSPAAVLGIINIRSAVQLDGAARVFRIDLTLVTTEMFLEYYEHPLTEYQVFDAGNGVTYVRFVNADPCAIQRITRTETVAPDGGARIQTVREVAYGSWSDPASLTYYPINQPVPVQINTENSNTTPSASDSEADSIS